MIDDVDLTVALPRLEPLLSLNSCDLLRTYAGLGAIYSQELFAFGGYQLIGYMMRNY